MTSGAEQHTTEESFALQATGTEGVGALRQTVAERLARHRSRRAALTGKGAPVEGQRLEPGRTSARSGVSRVRDAVTARYENSVSYREYLAAEGERALEKAQAEAEVAARNARALADVQIQLLQELEQWREPDPGPREGALEQIHAEARGELAYALADIALGARELIGEPVAVPGPTAPFEFSAQAPNTEAGRKAEILAASETPLAEVSSGGLTVKLYSGLEPSLRVPAGLQRETERAAESVPVQEEPPELEQEIAIRHAMERAAPHTLETTPIPANLIEFPRQLIAPRKARPRRAEGPLREEAPAEPQLRIFEVEPEQIATAPAEPTGAPGWQGLLLESATIDRHVPPVESQTHFTLQPQVAPLGKRLLATGVDSASLLVAVAACVELALHLGGAGLRHAPKPLLGTAAGILLAGFYGLYQMLFFSLNEATPGMRAARLALCTFGDDNPTRKAMRRRVLATFLAACPLGIGLLWTFLDGERLGWHDRMSRMYQRPY